MQKRAIAVRIPLPTASGFDRRDVREIEIVRNWIISRIKENTEVPKGNIKLQSAPSRLPGSSFARNIRVLKLYTISAFR